MKKLLINLLLCGSILTSWADEGQDVCFFRNGAVVYETTTDLVDSVSIKDGYIILYDKDGQPLYSTSQAQVDSITFHYDVPQADVLDVEFQPDGTAVDVSPMHNTIQKVDDGLLGIHQNTRYGRCVARFDNARSAAPASYYKVSYSGNAAFKQALSDGHSFETVFMSTFDCSASSAECKWFTGHQAGGTGPSVLGGQIVFLPNISTTGKSNYIHVNSGVEPRAGVYYHVVGVWDKDEAKARIYVNGQLMSEVDAPGELVLPSSAAAQWIGIGGDAKNASASEMGWNGDVVLARIYDKALTGNEAVMLWNKWESQTKEPMVSEVDFVSGLPVMLGQAYELAGQGFQEGDEVRLVNLHQPSISYTQSLTPLNADTASFTIPVDFQSGRYRMQLLRGDKTQELGWDSMTVVDRMPKTPLINSHRGLWNAVGSAQNSRASLSKAIEIGTWNSELDVWLTQDDSLVINHDATLGGVTIQTSTWEQTKDLTLANGETLPRFQEMLDIVSDSKGMRFLVEIKTHSTAARTRQAARAAMEAVQARGLDSITDYCSFSLDACKELIDIDSTACVFHISSQTPATVETLGLGGLSMQIGKYRSNPQWPEQLRQNGKMSIAWTLNTSADLIEMANAEVDVLATDWPMLGLKIRDYYKRHQSAATP